MSRKQIDTLLLWASIGAFLTMSVSFLLMPTEAVRIFAGALFWFCLFVGILLQAVLERRRRSFFARYHVQPQRMQRPHSGFLTFGANRYAKIADGVLAVSVICLGLSLWLTKGMGYLCYIGIAAATFSLCMHCILNGRIYVYVMNQAKIQRALEKRESKH